MLESTTHGTLTPAQELELNILAHGFEAALRERIFLLLLALDGLVKLYTLTNNPSRFLKPGKTHSDALNQHLIDTIRLAKHVFVDVTPEQEELIIGILESRTMAVGPKGRDSLGRSTRCIMTVKGRIIFD